MFIQKRILLLVASALATGCASMSSPVLRHEIGEALPPGNVRAGAMMGLSRSFPQIGAGSAATGIAQESSVFRGTQLGLYGAMGVVADVEAGLRTYYQWNGGGWRVNGKYEVMRLGSFAFAGVIGYGRFSGKGDIRFLTAGGSQLDVSHTQAGGTLDLGVPVSFRITPDVIIYSGLTHYRTSVSGTSGGVPVTSSENDLGVNLGLRVKFANFEIDGELAFLKASDTLGVSSQLVPYFGIGGGLVF